MKMDLEYYAVLQGAVSALDTEERRHRYETGDFPRADLDLRIGQSIFLPSGLKNDHIDTALRKIVAPLGGES